MVRLELFGGFRVTIGALVVPDEAWHRRKMSALIKLLCLAPKHRLRRDQITAALWPDLTPAAAAANLRKTVHYIRHMLPEQHYETNPIVAEGDLLGLPVEHIWVDVVAFRTQVVQARERRDLEAYAEVVELYRDGLLPEDDDEWTASYRFDLRRDYVAILEEYAGILEAAGLLEETARVAHTLIELDPLIESAHVCLMRVLALAGRRAEALRQYEVLRRVLQVELGIEPGPEAQRMHEEVRVRQVTEPALTSALWERVGTLRMVSGDPRGAVKAYTSALERTTGQADAARLHRLLASAHLDRHQVALAEPHLARAEAMTTDPAEAARLACLRGEVDCLNSDLDRALHNALRARALAAVHGTAEDRARAEEAIAMVSHVRGDWRRGLDAELRRAGGQLDTDTFVGPFDIHQCIGQFHLYSDELSRDVEQYARTTLAHASDAGVVRVQAFAWCLLGESLLLHEQFDEAAGCLGQSAELHASLGSTSGALPWQRLAEVAVCQQRYDEVGPALRRASAIATVSPMARHVWQRIHATAAFARLERGEPEQAARSIRAAAAAAARYGGCPTCGALLHPIAAETYAALGDCEPARAHAVAAARIAERFGGSAWQAMASSSAASAALVEGDPRAAGAAFTAAAAGYERVGHAYWARRSRRQAAGAAGLAGLADQDGNVHGTPRP
ncbi:BTAD domain-containing putative transcriptional regulator [Dactylosporangium salmoneum]|uniref:Bacterial transcriptional activator domain-containing protein n=1 Tax=Dactylosporangium salmoneum TaxID=53361 RepID=A0ABP5SMX3_9ACTN